MRKLIVFALCGLMLAYAAVAYAQTGQEQLNTVFLPITVTAPPEPEISEVLFYYSTSCSGDWLPIEPSNSVSGVRRLAVDVTVVHATGSTYRIEWWEGDDQIITRSDTIESDLELLDGGGLIYGEGGVCQSIFPSITFEVRIYLDGERIRTEKITTRN